VDGRSGDTVVRPTTDRIVPVPVRDGATYLVQRTAQPTTRMPFAAVTGTAATAAKHLGRVQLGLDPTADRPVRRRSARSSAPPGRATD